MIFKAKIDEGKEIIKLLNLAMEDMAFKLSGYDDFTSSNAILEKFFTQKENRLSYENILVYKVDDKIVGAICAYDGYAASRLDKPLNEHLQSIGRNYEIAKECFDGEFYIDSIAVNEKFRNQGIGAKLIRAAFETARKKRICKVALLVDTKKHKEREFYEKMGFVSNTTLTIYNKKYLHLIKDLM